MTDLFNKLYSQFLSGKTNQKDFEDFKDSLNHLSDQELSERMESFWNENLKSATIIQYTIKGRFMSR